MSPVKNSLLLCVLLAGCGSGLSVVDEKGAPVAGAEVFVDCASVGKTDADGKISITAAPGASISVRKLVETGATNKDLHDGWAWHAYITNVVQNDDGTQTDDQVGSGGEMPQIVVSQDNAMIGFHVVGSSDIDTSRGVGGFIGDSWELASPYLFDVTDGQMYIEEFDLYEEGMGIDVDADMSYRISVWPGGGAPSGPTTFVKKGIYMNMPVQGFNGNGYPYGTWTTPTAFRTAIHEFAHYTFDAHDEYNQTDANGQLVDATCPSPPPSGGENPEDSSMMWSQYVTSEMCNDSNHSKQTTHEQYAHDSVWGHFETTWDRDGYNITSPMDRGVVNPGPTALHCMASYSSELHLDDSAVCDELLLTATLPGGEPASGAFVTLDDGARLFAQGSTNANGQISVFGASPGDTLILLRGRRAGSLLELASGSVEVDERCQASVELRVYEDVIPVIPLPEFREDIFRIVFGDPRDIFGGIQVWISQGGSDRERIPVDRDEATGNLVAEYPINQERALDFRVSYRLEGEPVQAFETAFRAAPLAPPVLEDGSQPEVWSPLGVDGPGIVISAGVAPEDAYVLFGETMAPEPAPQGSIFVGGPWSLSLPEGVTVPFTAPIDLTNLCGEAPMELRLLRAAEGEWVDVGAVIGEADVAATLQSGVYALTAADRACK